MFPVYLQLGFEHIADIKAYDHMLFLIALCAVYTPGEWKRVLVLVTAFTIGHSITLALSALNIVYIPSTLIEVLIPVTIFLTAIKNLFLKKRNERTWDIAYLLPLFFGLIHGLGFASYFKSLLGQEANVVLPLFAFNVGVEIGQICIVGLILLIHFLAIKGFRISPVLWNRGVSVLVALISAYLFVMRLF